MTTQSPRKFQRKIPLLAVLATLFISLNLIAVAAVGYLSFRNGYEAVNSVAAQLRREIGARIEDHLRTFARTPFIINQTNADLIRQGLLPSDDQTALERHFWHQVQEFESVSSIYFGNPQGGLADAGREGAGGFLYVIATDHFTAGPFKKYAADEQGRRTELLLEVPNFDARTRGWYTHAVEAGESVWNAPYILFSGQDMAIAASQPVYSPDGALLGVVSVDIFLSQLSDFLQSLEIGKTGQAFIVERESGLLVAASTETPLFTSPPGETPRERIPALESESTLIRRVTETLVSQAGSLETVTAERQFAVVIDGVSYFAQVTPFQDQRGLDWLVMVVIPEADFMAQVQANTRLTLLLMAGTLLATGALTVLLTYRILGPIKSLAGFSRAIQQGGWGKTISHDSRIAEISLMTQAFNQMSRQMAVTIANLNREIAAHQESAQALRESEHRLRSIVEQLNDGVSITDEQGRLIVWNRRLEEFTGLPAETMLGKYLWDVQFELLPPEEQTPERRARLEKDLRAFLATGQSPWSGKLLEREFTRPDGRTLYLEGVAFSIQTSSGYMLGSIIRDITARKRIELERDAARQLFQKMFELSPVAIALSSVAERRIVDVNTATERLLGYSRAELIGQHSPAIDYWANPEERQQAFETLLAEGRIAGYEFTFKTKSGQTGRALIFAELFEQQGEQYILSAFVDITELQSYRQQLEELVAERTAELQQSNKDLKEANQRYERLSQELQAVNAELKTFAYTVSHDLKAPLRGIDGYSRLLLEAYYDRLDEEGRLFLGNIRQAVRQMNRLIDDLLAYFRMERRTLTPRTFSLVRLVEGLLAEKRAEIEAAGTVVSVQIEHAEITTDSDGLTIALRNLIDNAIKFSAGVASPHIEIGARRTGDHCLIWVKDNGIGFDMQFQERIFEIFQRLHTDEEYAGTGVGLAIVRKAIERMGGRIRAESIPGQGTTFYLEIPQPITAGASPSPPE